MVDLRTRIYSAKCKSRAMIETHSIGIIQKKQKLPHRKFKVRNEEHKNKIYQTPYSAFSFSIVVFIDNKDWCKYLQRFEEVIQTSFSRVNSK